MCNFPLFSQIITARKDQLCTATFRVDYAHQIYWQIFVLAKKLTVREETLTYDTIVMFSLNTTCKTKLIQTG